MSSSSAAADRPSDRARSLLPGSGDRMPWTALTAGICGIVAVVPLLLMALLLFALGGLSSDSAREPWVWLVLLAPVVQFVATLWLFTRHGWVPMLLAVVPAALFTGAIYWTANENGDPVGVGPLLIVLFPLLAAGFAVARPTRLWLAGRPGRAPRKP
ncbi:MULTISPECIES: hypothetical protein [unclassified Blastococcus]